MSLTERFRYRGDTKPFVSTTSFGILQTTKKPYTLKKSAGTPLHMQHGASVNVNSSMKDYVSPLDEFGLRQVKEVDHVKLVKALPVQSFQTTHEWYPYFGTTNWEFRDGCFRQQVDPAFLNAKFPSPSSNELSSFTIRSFSKMTEQFPLEISLVNSLIELRELPELISTVGNVWDLVKAIKGRKWGDALSVRRAADFHASYNFGISPLIGDVTKSGEIMEIVHKRLRHLQRTHGKKTRVGYQEKIVQNVDLPLETFLSSINGEQCQLSITKVEHVIMNTAKVRNDLDWVWTWEGIVRGLIGVTGLDNPWQIAWNAAPFSWLVNYVLPVADVIESYKFQDVSGWHVTKACSSIKSQYTITVKIRSRHGIITTLGSFVIQRYRRFRNFFPIVIGFEPPNAKQLSLLAAVSL